MWSSSSGYEQESERRCLSMLEHGNRTIGSMTGREDHTWPLRKMPGPASSSGQSSASIPQVDSPIFDLFGTSPAPEEPFFQFDADLSGPQFDFSSQLDINFSSMFGDEKTFPWENKDYEFFCPKCHQNLVKFSDYGEHVCARKVRRSPKKSEEGSSMRYLNRSLCQKLTSQMDETEKSLLMESMAERSIRSSKTPDEVGSISTGGNSTIIAGQNMSNRIVHSPKSWSKDFTLGTHKPGAQSTPLPRRVVEEQDEDFEDSVDETLKNYEEALEKIEDFEKDLAKAREELPKLQDFEFANKFYDEE